MTFFIHPVKCSDIPKFLQKKKFVNMLTTELCLQEVLVVGEPSMMGCAGEFGGEDERTISRMENSLDQSPNPLIE